MPYRNKTFVSFDGDSDMSYYRLMQAWRQNDGIAFNFYDAWPARCFVPVGMRVYITGDTGDRDADGCGIARL